MNTKAMCRLVFHGVAAITYLVALVRYEYLPPMPHKKSHEHFAGRLKYLTYWNLIAQCVYFTFSCVIDIMKSSTSTYTKWTRIRDKFYAGIALPYGVFVFCMFWGLYAIDRELIFPRILDTVFPAWLNHVSHTVILPVLLMETYILKHKHPRRKEGLRIALLFGLVYGLWVLYLGFYLDIWVYPILGILSWLQRFIFFGISVGIIVSVYFVGERINVLFWGESVLMKVK